ncbi:hypothetical protein [Marivirga sp.]|uniref:hypothetical protein n=1 Tax=Marivirga sp. TaxID=2018662 RepID=UPI002D7EAB91|nr:hypothetical protein [Marivirga sp.]HET8859408.1 hypothetical protein [Marivirga sp.]
MKNTIIHTLLFLLFASASANSQSVEPSIEIIRENYVEIRNKMNTIKKKTINASGEDSNDPQSGHRNEFVLYIQDSDTLLIQEFNINDEGGPYSLSVTEVYYKDSQPFFYFNKYYASWESSMTETRLYIKNDTVIKKLKKKYQLHWKKIPNYDLLQVKSDTIPNKEVDISKYEIGGVHYVKNSLNRLTK